MNEFSYLNYVQLVETIKATIPLMDFAKIKKTDQQFFILRHDVEFSVEKAYELATLEHDRLDIQSSYFFQLRNYSYNVLSFKNMGLIKKMESMGHKIGLHVNMSGLESLDNIADFIKNDVTILQNGLGMPIDRFSYHRPTHTLLGLHLKIDGLINAYDKLFFHLDNTTADNGHIHYFSDSQHQWKYGNPLSILESPIKKIQLLIHPYSWSKQGYDNLDNFKALIALKEDLMRQSMQDECQHFPSELRDTPPFRASHE
ncbi:MAG: hypothetical protein Q8R79_06650 [Legionellaceae bacterium]|nr:hypothetical protein [Legionellaceae bacterium]